MPRRLDQHFPSTRKIKNMPKLQITSHQSWRILGSSRHGFWLHGSRQRFWIVSRWWSGALKSSVYLSVKVWPDLSIHQLLYYWSPHSQFFHPLMPIICKNISQNSYLQRRHRSKRYYSNWNVRWGNHCHRNDGSRTFHDINGRNRSDSIHRASRRWAWVRNISDGDILVLLYGSIVNRHLVYKIRANWSQSVSPTIYSLASALQNMLITAIINVNLIFITLRNIIAFITMKGLTNTFRSLRTQHLISL